VLKTREDASALHEARWWEPEHGASVPRAGGLGQGGAASQGVASHGGVGQGEVASQGVASHGGMGQGEVASQGTASQVGGAAQRGDVSHVGGGATKRVHCYLCPRHCHIGDGQAGFCFIRENRGGKLYSLGYAHPAALQIDPIEKKPLNHFLPGTRVFSMGTAGCNMGCFFCQNWDISKSRSDQVRSSYVPPEDVAQLAIRNGCPSIAFTYNEPTIWGEYVVDICQAAKEYGLKTVMVSNGYITREAFHDIYDHIDAANIDLKAFTENFYGRVTLTHLQPVLETLQWLKNETNVWFEITNLIIPTLNDATSETRQLAEWVLEHLGPDVPLHFTAFHPDFKLRDKPPTPPQTIHAARAIALEVGLHYVYEGNIHNDGHSDDAHTLCPSCNAMLIRRSWHSVLENRLKDGCCPSCGLAIPGRWTNREGELSRRPFHNATSAAANRHSELNL
jgi:pyruvate formate lyase activating enzyme